MRYLHTFNVNEFIGSNGMTTEDFPLFNPALGTLFEVDCQLESTAVSSAFVSGLSSMDTSTGTATASNAASFKVEGPSLSKSFAQTTSTGCSIEAGSVHCFIGSDTIGDFNFDAPVPTADYIGVGTFEADFSYGNNPAVSACPAV